MFKISTLAIGYNVSNIQARQQKKKRELSYPKVLEMLE